MSELILVRGLPGSGKSTLSKKLAAVMNSNHYEADQYFITDGVYKFDINYIVEAHEWCQDSTRKSLDSGTSVIVSNTFTTRRELFPYFYMAAEFGIVPQIVLCQGQWGSIHGVPEETLERMKNRFQFDVSDLYGEDYV